MEVEEDSGCKAFIGFGNHQNSRNSIKYVPRTQQLNTPKSSRGLLPAGSGKLRPPGKRASIKRNILNDPVFFMTVIFAVVIALKRG